MTVPRNQFEIVGLKELVKDLSKFGDEAIIAISPVVDSAGDIVLAKTKEKVPTRSGRLKDSLFLRRPKPKKMIAKNTLTWGKDVRAYAAAVELGHELVSFGKRTGKRIAARPFLRPGADESKEKVFRMLIAGMDKILKKFGD